MNPLLRKEQLHELEPYFLNRLKKVLQIPSVYDEGSVSEGAPFGKSIQEALEYTLSLGTEEGFSVKDVDGYAGHIEWGEGEDLIGILGHLDVVPPGEGWTNPPFEPAEKEGKLYARGAQDDKGPVMAAFLAMKWLKDLGIEPQKRVRLILGTDEERNWGCMKHYFEKEEMPSVGFTPDAQFPVIHAEKGLIDLEVTKDIELEQKNAKAQLVQLQGGERLNMVPFRAQATVIWSGEKDPIALFEDFIQQTPFDGEAIMDGDQLQLFLTGKSAHAMEPENGHNAFLGLVSFLKQLPFSTEILAFLNWMDDAFSNSRGKGVGIACEDDVSGPLTVNVGTAVLQNQQVTLGLNIRYPVTEAFQEWFEIFEKNMNDQEASIHVTDHLKAIYMDKNHPFVEKLLTIYNKNTDEQAEPLAIGGATYARALDQGVAYGAMFAHSPDTAHNADEHVLIEDLVGAAYIYAEAIYELIAT